MGTLTATGFRRASHAANGREALATADMAAFWRAYRDDVAERVKAKVGDKTLLDVLDPIAPALEAEATNGAALAATADAPDSALEATRSIIVQYRKAAAFRRKTVGLQDTGATVGHLLIRRVAVFVTNR